MRALWFAVGWAIAAAIVWLSVTPAPPKVDFDQSDKVGHLIAYGGLMFWFCQLYVRSKTRLAYAAGFIALGVALEFVQRALGYRSFEVADMIADALGVLAGWVAALVLPRLLKA
jgi:VanZ family protein